MRPPAGYAFMPAVQAFMQAVNADYQRVHAGCQRVHAGYRGVHAGYQRVHALCQCVPSSLRPTGVVWDLQYTLYTVLMLTGGPKQHYITCLAHCAPTLHKPFGFLSTPSFYCRTLVGSLPLSNNGQHSASYLTFNVISLA